MSANTVETDPVRPSEIRAHVYADMDGALDAAERALKELPVGGVALRFTRKNATTEISKEMIDAAKSTDPAAAGAVIFVGPKLDDELQKYAEEQGVLFGSFSSTEELIERMSAVLDIETPKGAGPRPCGNVYPIAPFVTSFIFELPFFGEMLRRMNRVPTLDIPTLAVGFDKGQDSFCLWYNPYYVKRLAEETETISVTKGGVSQVVRHNAGWRFIRAALAHECYHIIFGHLDARRHTPHAIWNIATDLAINSLIHANDEYRDNNKACSPIHPSWLLPGRWSTNPDGRELTKDEKEAAKMMQIIATLPMGNTSEWYFHTLLNEGLKNGAIQISNDGTGERISDPHFRDSTDSHDFWDKIPDEQREYVRTKAKEMIEQAVKEADRNSNGWGNMSADMREAIRASVARTVDWRSMMKNFIGQLVRGERTNSIKRVNKKYPYVHPGRKHKFVAKLLIAIDQSGSVDNEMLARFFSELEGLTRKVTVDVLPFDCSADVKDVYTWRKGQKIECKRVKTGGTDFNAPTAVMNDPKNRGRWDGMIILTDGIAPAPGACRKKRAWLLGKGCKLEWKTGDLVMSIDDERRSPGAWR